MGNLKNKVIIISVFWGLIGCATSFYKVARQQGVKNELTVSSDRIVIKCYKVSDENDRFMFFIHILDEKNTVLDVIQGSTLSDRDCNRRLKSVENIVSYGKKIYIAGMGDINRPRIRHEDETAVYFPGHGAYYSNDRVLQFFAIKNELGHCYDTYNSDPPCPHNNFPIRDEDEHLYR